jgi:hypothetical protein
MKTFVTAENREENEGYSTAVAIASAIGVRANPKMAAIIQTWPKPPQCVRRFCSPRKRNQSHQLKLRRSNPYFSQRELSVASRGGRGKFIARLLRGAARECS